MPYIDWIDHHGDSALEWRSKGDIIERSAADVVVRTYGEILYEDEDKIILAGERRLDADLWQPLYRHITTVMKKLLVGRGDER